METDLRADYKSSSKIFHQTYTFDQFKRLPTSRPEGISTQAHFRYIYPLKVCKARKSHINHFPRELWK